MEYAVLVDPEKCIGCRGCQVTCKRWNDKPAEKTGFSNEWTNPPKLSYNTYTHIQFKLDKKVNGDTDWAFFNWRCMQCHDPACKEACPVNAITKYEEGPVVIDIDRCIGCKFCVTACPFEVPKFDPTTGKVDKCTMCFDRVPQKEPACVQTCPTSALVFGERETIIQKAKERKAELNGHIYGAVDNKPLGGTSFIYVLKEKPSFYGLPDVGENISAEVSALKNSKWLLIPAALGGLVYLTSWRQRRLKEKEE